MNKDTLIEYINITLDKKKSIFYLWVRITLWRGVLDTTLCD